MVVDVVVQAIRGISRFLARFKHPYSLPEEVARALGVSLPNQWSMERVVRFIESTSCKPVRLSRMMGRDEAEEAFDRALRQERFRFSSLFSYQFVHGWLEFSLQFDPQNRLRRCYVYHKDSPDDTGYELPLAS